jgi:dTDP-4-dehydrorhamnose 3,5-epimerase
VRFVEGPIPDVLVKELTRHRDHRGWLAELFRDDEIDVSLKPAMAYISETSPGVARGPHEHRHQADLFCFLGPSTFRLYLWDARTSSESYGRKMVIEAGELQPRSVLVPAGVVHAYKNVGSVPGWVVNLPNQLYAGRGRKEPADEIRHENDATSPFVID